MTAADQPQPAQHGGEPHEPTEFCIDNCNNPFECRDAWDAWIAAHQEPSVPNVHGFTNTTNAGGQESGGGEAFVTTEDLAALARYEHDMGEAQRLIREQRDQISALTQRAEDAERDLAEQIRHNQYAADKHAEHVRLLSDALKETREKAANALQCVKAGQVDMASAWLQRALDSTATAPEGEQRM